MRQSLHIQQEHWMRLNPAHAQEGPDSTRVAYSHATGPPPVMCIVWTLCRQEKEFKDRSRDRGFLVIIAAMILPAFIRARKHTVIRLNALLLRQNRRGETAVGARNHKTTNDTPRWKKVTPYLKNSMTCPHGGT